MNLKKIIYNQYTIYSAEDVPYLMPEPSVTINLLSEARVLQNKGRGGIKVFEINGRLIVCRKYIHGGILRALTNDIFFRDKRAIKEFEILFYLNSKGFPAVEPCCVMSENHLMAKKLYILTVFEENASDLIQVLKTCGQRERYWMAKEFAGLMWKMESLGVYHPDMHLSNVIVTPEGKLKFLDFDKACRKLVVAEDTERMLWRLDRYVEKMEKQGKLKIDVKEKLLFLRTYRKLSGFDIAAKMSSKKERKNFLSRVGWFFESLLYGKQMVKNHDEEEK